MKVLCLYLMGFLLGKSRTQEAVWQKLTMTGVLHRSLVYVLQENGDCMQSSSLDKPLGPLEPCIMY